VNHIAQVIREAGHSIRPPTFPGQIRVQPLPKAPDALQPVEDAFHVEWAEPATENLIAVFFDSSLNAVDELHFDSLADAYDHAWSLGPQVIRCELYEEFAGVRGKHRVTYLRKGQTQLWVPLLT
jgi:hypothetical protein